MNCHPNAMLYQVPILVPVMPVMESNSTPKDEEVEQETSEATATTAASNSSNEASKNAVSLLQEYVQTSKRGYRQPQNRATLQWKFDASTHGSKRLFRARVAFVLDGIPHYVMGGWHARKKLAQQDAANGCLSLFIGEWGNSLSHPELTDMPKQALAALGNFCSKYPPICDSESNDLHWSIERLDKASTSIPGEAYRALLNIHIFDVPHTFAGCLCRTPDAAKADTASRFLWYLQCPNFEHLYEIDLVAAAHDTLAGPSAQWQIRDTSHLTAKNERWRGSKGDTSLAETCKQIELLLETAEPDRP